MVSIRNKIEKMDVKIKKPNRLIGCLILTALMVFSVPCDGRPSQSSKPVLETPSHTVNHNNSFKQGLRLTAADKIWLSVYPKDEKSDAGGGKLQKTVATAPSPKAVSDFSRDNPIKIVYPVVMAPYTFKDDKGEPQGFSIDLLRLWSKKTGIPIEFKSAVWAETLQTMRDGNADIHASLNYTKERDTYLDFATIVASTEGTIFFHKSITNISDPEDLRGYRVGVVKGGLYVGWIQENLPESSLVSYIEFPQMVDAAQKKDVYVFIDELQASLYRMKELGVVDEFSYNPGMGIYPNNFWIAARQGDSKLVKALKQGMALITSEERAAIERKWLTISTVKTQDTLFIAMYSDFAPYTFINAEGQPAGLFVDIWKLWAKKTGKKIRFLPGSWQTSLDNLKKGTADIHSGLFYSDSRAQWLDYSQPFYETSSYVFYSIKKEEPYKDGIYIEKKIGVIKGSYHEEHLRIKHPTVDVIPFESMEKMLRAVLSGEISACLTEYLSATAMINRLGLSGGFNSTESMHLRQKLYAGVLKNNTQLHSLVKKGFDAITKNELAEIEKHWVTEHDKQYYRKAVEKIPLTESETAWLKVHPDIVLGYTDTFEPEVIVNPDGSYQGIMVDFLDALNQRLGTSIRLRIDPVPELVEKSQKKEVDGILSLTSEYADKLGLLKTRGHVTNYPAVFARKDIAFNHPSNLVHKRVAIIDKVFFSEKIVERYGDGATILKVKDALEGLQRVGQGKADFFLGASLNAYLITKYQLFDLATQYVFYDYPIDAVIATRSDWPELSAILDKGLSSFSKEEIEDITAKWIALPEKQYVTVELTPEERAWLKAHPNIQLGYTDEFEPEVIVNPDGTYRGILIDFLTELNRRLGTRIDLHFDSIPGILEKAKTKAVDGILEMHPEYADKLGLLKSVGYLTAYPAVFARQNVSFEGPADFAGKRVAIIDNVYFSEKLVRQYGEQATILKVKDAEQGMKAVSAGDADLFIGVSFNSFLLTKYQLFDVVAKYTFLDYPDKFGMAIRPDWPELVSILNKGISSFSKNEIDAIVAKWIHLPQQEKTVELTSAERAWVREHPTIKVALFPVAPYMLHEKGEFRGYLVEVIQAMCRQAGIKAEFSMQPLAETLTKLQNGKAHVSLGMIHNEERASFLNFSEKTIDLQMGIFAQTERSDISDKDSLRNKSIASYNKYGFESVLQKDLPSAQIIRAEDAEGMLRLVAAGEADAAVQEVHSGEYLLREGFINGVHLKGIFRTRGSETIPASEYAVGKKFPLLKLILDKSYKAIRESDKKRIWEKWFGGDIVKPAKLIIALTPQEKAWLTAHPIITLGGGNFPPLDFFDETKGQSDGVGPDYAKLIGSMLGIEFKLVSGDWQDIQNMAKAKKIDGIRLIFKIKEREKYLNYTKPVVKIAHAIVMKKETRGVSSLKELSHKRVGTLKGLYAYHYMKEHYPDLDLITYPTWEKVLQALVNNEVEAVVGTLPVLTYMINKLFITNLKVVALPIEMERNVYLGIRPDWPELSVIINKAIDAITIKQHSEIKSKWITLYPVTEENTKVVLTTEEQAWLDQNHTVQVRVVNIPPYIILKKGADPEGISIDYLKLISERTGVTFKYVFSGKSFPEALNGLKRHQGPDLITSTVRTPEREKTILYSRDYVRSPYVIFTQAEDKAFIADMTDLRGKQIALPRGTVIHEKVKSEYPELNLVLYDDDAQAIEAVATQKADAYIGNLTLTSFLILEKGLSNIKIAGPSPFGDHVFSMGIRNDWPELTSIIDKTLASISPEKQAEIRNKYISIRYEHTETAVIIKWIFIIGGAASGIVLLLFFWNRSLAKQVQERTSELETTNISLETEIDDRKRAEETLRYQATLLENVSDAVVSIDTDFKIRSWNNASVKTYGWKAEEVMGKVFSEVTSLEYLHGGREDVLFEINKAGFWRGEVKQTRKDGEQIYIQVTVSAILGDKGKTIGFVAVNRDITDRKEAEQTLQRYQQRLKALASQLTITEETERRRIAADLHDHVGQSLALARMQVAAASKSVSDDGLTAKLDDVSETLLQTVQDVRHLMFDLSSPTMHELGLRPAISEWLEEQIERRYEIKTKFFDDIVDRHKIAMDENVRAILFRNVRELLTNVVKHAQANQVTVSMELTDNTLKIVVQDDGVGFEYLLASQTGGPKGGFGLFSIRERMADLGGTLEIESEPGKGCTAVLSMPLDSGLK